MRCSPVATLAVLAMVGGLGPVTRAQDGTGSEGPNDVAALTPQSVPGLAIFGLADMLTGWHEVEARTDDPRIESVQWWVDGRQAPSTGQFAARVNFGQTPQPRTVVAVGLDSDGNARLRARRLVNAGGLATDIWFASPVSGAAVQGLTEIEVCVRSPADLRSARVVLEYRQRDRPDAVQVVMDPVTRSRCDAGMGFWSTLPLSSSPASLTARIEPANELQAGVLAYSRPERSVLVNMPPGIEEVVDVRWLEWPVMVAKNGRAVADLGPDNFEISEGSKACAVKEVLLLREAPLRIGLMFDWSHSTTDDLTAEARAASEFLGELFVSGKDSVLVAGISSRPIPYLHWTSDAQAIAAALDRVRSGITTQQGGTALYDTLMQVLYEFQSPDVKGSPAIVLMTDGYDTTSELFDREQVLAYARESGVPVYPITVRARLAGGLRTGADVGFLDALAQSTGGAVHVIEVSQGSATLTSEARAHRREAEDLRQNPGELAQDPRFLEYLIDEEESKAEALEQKAAALAKKDEAHLAQIRLVFRRIREDLRSSYLVVAKSPIPRQGQWRPVEVRLTGVDAPGRYEVRAPGGVFW